MPAFRAEMAKVPGYSPKHVTFDLTSLTTITSGAVRELALIRQKLDLDEGIEVIGATGQVREQLELAEFYDGVEKELA